MRREPPTGLPIADLIVVLEALIPRETVSVDSMLLLLSRLRSHGRVVTLHFSPRAFAKLARAVDLSREQLEDALAQAPHHGRERIQHAITQPENHGCTHLRAQLDNNSAHASALLEAFVAAGWFGWPGLRIEVAEDGAGACCCGTELVPSQRSRMVSRYRPMSAIDI